MQRNRRGIIGDHVAVLVVNRQLRLPGERDTTEAATRLAGEHQLVRRSRYRETRGRSSSEPTGRRGSEREHRSAATARERYLTPGEGRDATHGSNREAVWTRTAERSCTRARAQQEIDRCGAVGHEVTVGILDVDDRLRREGCSAARGTRGTLEHEFRRRSGHREGSGSRIDTRVTGLKGVERVRASGTSNRDLTVRERSYPAPRIHRRSGRHARTAE